ncbi:argininosuccinate lyase, partial [Acidithiobacillus sp. GGI-221]
MSEKMWGGRFAAGTDRLVEAFTASIQVDRRLYAEDIRGSMAHARMLGRVGVLTEAEVEAIVTGLAQVRQEIVEDRLPFCGCPGRHPHARRVAPHRNHRRRRQ